MPRTSHLRLAFAGFSPQDTDILISIFDTASAKYPDADINNIIIDALYTMARAGSRSFKKLAAYVAHQTSTAALAKYGPSGLPADSDENDGRPEPPAAAWRPSCGGGK